MRYLSLAALGCVALACQSAAAQFDNPVTKEFQGRWVLTGFELAGGKLRVVLGLHGGGRVSDKQMKAGDTLLLPACLERTLCLPDGVFGILVATLPH